MTEPHVYQIGYCDGDEPEAGLGEGCPPVPMHVKCRVLVCVYADCPELDWPPANAWGDCKEFTLPDRGMVILSDLIGSFPDYDDAYHPFDARDVAPISAPIRIDTLRAQLCALHALASWMKVPSLGNEGSADSSVTATFTSPQLLSVKGKLGVDSQGGHERWASHV